MALLGIAYVSEAKIHDKTAQLLSMYKRFGGTARTLLRDLRQLIHNSENASAAWRRRMLAWDSGLASLLRPCIRNFLDLSDLTLIVPHDIGGRPSLISEFFFKESLIAFSLSRLWWWTAAAWCLRYLSQPLGRSLPLKKNPKKRILLQTRAGVTPPQLPTLTTK